MHACLTSSYIVMFRDVFCLDVNSADLCWVYWYHISFYLVPHHQTKLQALTIDQISFGKSKVTSSVKNAPDNSDQQYS